MLSYSDFDKLHCLKQFQNTSLKAVRFGYTSEQISVSKMLSYSQSDSQLDYTSVIIQTELLTGKSLSQKTEDSLQSVSYAVSKTHLQVPSICLHSIILTGF